MLETEHQITAINQNSEVRKNKMLLFAQTMPGNLPISAQRLFLAILTSINPKEEGNVFVIKGNDIAELANVPKNVVGQQLQEMSISADSLRKYTLVIDEEDGNQLRVGLISSTKYLKGQRAIRVSIDPYLMPHLREMKEKFAISYPVGGPMKFRSEYSLPLYDYANYYLHEGHFYFDVAQVRRMFNVTDGKLATTSSLNQRVVNPALKDINTHTNLEISIEYEKKARTIVGYHFYVRNKEESAIAESVNKPDDSQELENLVTELVVEHKFNKAVLADLINRFGFKSCKNNYQYALQKSPRDLPRYLYWCVTNQIFERELEVKQVREINKNYIPENSQLVFHDEQPLFDEFTEAEENKETVYDRIKRDNPELYEIMQRINKKRKEE